MPQRHAPHLAVIVTLDPGAERRLRRAGTTGGATALREDRG
jgi:hypothetical protein